MSSNAVSIGQAALVFHDASRLLDSALARGRALLRGRDADLAVLDPRVHAVRPHHGQVEVARRLRELLGDFEPRERSPPGRVHDAFVFRCVPQVEGTLLDALERLESVLAIELNVAGENALMLPRDGVALPNGNFHAGVLTLALDALRGAMAQSASLVAARVSALLDPEVTGLAPQLAQDPGPDSGAMIMEYTAHAAAAEVRSLAATAASQTTSVQSGIESHANFAGHSSRRTSDALGRMAVAVSAELVLAVRALRLRGAPPRGAGVRALFEAADARLDPRHGRPAAVRRPRSGAAAALRRRAVDEVRARRAALTSAGRSRLQLAERDPANNVPGAVAVRAGHRLRPLRVSGAGVPHPLPRPLAAAAGLADLDAGLTLHPADSVLCRGCQGHRPRVGGSEQPRVGGAWRKECPDGQPQA